MAHSRAGRKGRCLVGRGATYGDFGVAVAFALSFFEAEVEPGDFHVQRHAELLLDMGRTDKAEAMLKAHRRFDSSCWIHRLMARARLAQNDAAAALTWINRALA